MLARSRTVLLRRTASFRTPILVPSVSSKGFPEVNGHSEAGALLRLLLNDSDRDALLVSAYDLHHGLLVGAGIVSELELLAAGSGRLLIVDSGGFELTSTWDSGDIYRPRHDPLPFGEDDFRAVVDSLEQDDSTVVVTYDDPSLRLGFEKQLDQAAALAAARPDLSVDFLLKPEGDGPLDVSKALEAVGVGLASFEIVGVTEQELGSSFLERCLVLRSLRRGLDRLGVESPIHVFGVLDPLAVSLYFMCGAEIFDGLTWTRYTTHEGLSVYRDSHAILTGDLDVDTHVRDRMSQLRFLASLQSLGEELRQWAIGGADFSALRHNADALREAEMIIREQEGDS